jgi:protein-S-isoprenylcysteine O-methyltransferase Ste14
MMLWQLIAFAVLSAVLVYVSRASLLRPRSHGFSRFFAWEAIAALFVLNAEHWFVDPLAWHQIVAWALLVACLVPVTLGTVALRRHGRPTARREGDPTLLSFEKTSRLVTTGIYGYIRHPLYCSLLLLAWGIFFKLPSLPGGALAFVASVFLLFTALADEAECARFFGPEYAAYKQRTRRFIPFVA